MSLYDDWVLEPTTSHTIGAHTGLLGSTISHHEYYWLLDRVH